ncbi:MAG: hypothetical protein HYY11_02960 [Candidatus Methylomirabilis oxyfera]|nr:hypothetical protein [Candidatus Methylomirabilis oxyfera]
MDTQIAELLKWAGPAAALIYFILRELKERRKLDDIIKGYEQVVTDQGAALTKTATALTQLIERLEPGSALTEHLTYNTQVMTKLCDRIDTWDRRMTRCNERGGV